MCASNNIWLRNLQDAHRRLDRVTWELNSWLSVSFTPGEALRSQKCAAVLCCSIYFPHFKYSYCIICKPGIQGNEILEYKKKFVIFYKFHFYSFIILYAWNISKQMWWCAYGGQGATHESWFVPSTVCLLRIKLKIDGKHFDLLSHLIRTFTCFVTENSNPFLSGFYRLD